VSICFHVFTVWRIDFITSIQCEFYINKHHYHHYEGLERENEILFKASNKVAERDDKETLVRTCILIHTDLLLSSDKMYVYMYALILNYTHTWLYMYIYLYRHIYPHMYTHIYKHVYLYIYIYIYISIGVA
jgi:hypothetical protein